MLSDTITVNGIRKLLTRLNSPKVSHPDNFQPASKLSGRSGGGREKEGELATTSLKFEYLSRRSRCQMLIGGDYISNDLINLGRCFSMFVHIRAGFLFGLIGGNLTAQSTGSHRGIGGRIQIPETQLQAFLSFPAPPPERPGELTHRLDNLHSQVLKELIIDRGMNG